MPASRVALELVQQAAAAVDVIDEKYCEMAFFAAPYEDPDGPEDEDGQR